MTTDINPLFQLEEKTNPPYSFTEWFLVGKSPIVFTPLQQKVLPVNDDFFDLKEKHPLVWDMASTFDRVNCNFELYEKSLKKGDAQPKKPIADPLWETAKEYAKIHVGFLTGSHPTETFSINKTTSAGVLGKILGKKNKQELLEDADLLETLMSEWYAPVYSAEAKDEILSKYDILERQKLRTFFSCCTVGLLWQKYFYSDQNKRLKLKDSWIKYGFVKQFGGYSDLVGNYETCDFKGSGDVSGWDRFFPLLEDVCELRRSFLEDSLEDHEKHRLDWVEEFLINHYVITKDGWIYRKSIGNPSGSNNTTEDNCLGHLMIFFYYLLKMWHKVHLTVATYEDCVNFGEASIYGDDNLFGLRSPVIGITTEELSVLAQETYQEVFAAFGMPVKFLKTETGFGPITSVQEGGDLEFLGSLPVQTEWGLLPKPNCSHLASSLLSLFGCTETFAVVSKIKAALDLCFLLKEYDRECELITNFCFDACKVLIQKEDLPLSDQIFLSSVLNKAYWPLTLVTGLESGLRVNDLQVIFYPDKEDGRNKSHYNMSNNARQNNKTKREGQKIHELQLKLHEEKLKNRAKNSRSRANASHNECVNAVKNLTMGIINPDSVGGLRWPDLYSESTCSYKSINNFFLPVKQTTAIPIDNYPDGSFYCEVHPELENTVRYLREIDGVSEEQQAIAVLDEASYEATNLYGLYSGDVRVPMMIKAGNAGTFDLVLPYRMVGGSEQMINYVPADSNLGNEGFYYLPIRGLSPSGLESMVSIDWTTGYTATPFNVSMKLEQVALDGTVLTSSTSAGVTFSNVTSTHTLTLVTSPNDLFSYKIRVTPVKNSGSPVYVTLTHIRSNYSADDLMLEVEPIPDLSQLVSDVEKYRVTAQSGLVSYFGSTLTNAGFITSILYRGGFPSTMAGLVDYSSISEHPSSYDGALRDGSYGYWEGMDSVDYSYRTVQSLQSYKRPYLVFTGLYNGDASSGQISSLNVLRMRVITLVEFTSKSQVYDSLPSPVCLNALAEAMRVLGGVPNTMENGKHFAKLKQIASKAGKTMLSLGQFAWNHRKEIEQAYKAAVPVLGTFL